MSDVGAAGAAAARRVRLPRGVRPADLAVALAFAAWGVAITAFPSAPHPLVRLPVPVGELICVALLTAVMVFRRARPMTTALVTAAITLIYPGNWFLYGALYAAGAHLPRRVHLCWLVPLVFGASFVGERGWIGFRVNDNAFLLFATVLVSLAGLYDGTRRELVAAAHERADRAEREQQLLAETARRGTRTARGRDARRGDAPGERHGAAGRRPRSDDRGRRGPRRGRRAAPVRPRRVGRAA
ncbi:hypothetical protein LQ327_32215 [Actinomycetospora endophytica]|uniref:Integral membrane protein n=1 Tax=Actinomycetospora endophytica TaxID=2291215 RepID=A0ABS8PIE2_9PSEU|nr:hypothetical protein [Actinomycetospora endophytica]MCD2198047.1 hypothetical protein [Actinomycetospora endophytica]